MTGVRNIRNLVDYFKKNLAKGYTFESLKWALINQGYSKLLVERAIEQAHKELAEAAPVLKEKPKIRYEIIGADNRPIRLPWWKRFSNLLKK